MIASFSEGNKQKVGVIGDKIEFQGLENIPTTDFRDVS